MTAVDILNLFKSVVGILLGCVQSESYSRKGGMVFDWWELVKVIRYDPSVKTTWFGRAISFFVRRFP
jgi:hypothetical protein